MIHVRPERKSFMDDKKRLDKCKLEVTKSYIKLTKDIVAWRISQEEKGTTSHMPMPKYATDNDMAVAIAAANGMFTAVKSDLRVELIDSKVIAW